MDLERSREVWSGEHLGQYRESRIESQLLRQVNSYLHWPILPLLPTVSYGLISETAPSKVC